MTRNALRTVRTIIRSVVYACCALAVLFTIAQIGSVLINSFSPFSDSSTFADESGVAAKRLIHEWPADVDPSNVRRVSGKQGYSFDSHSSWYKIELDANSAQVWADTVHANRERDSIQSLRKQDRGLEAVRRIVPGPPPLHRTTGPSPFWWTPPSVEFRATEAMKWYSGYGSGVGQAAYTGYDAERQTLWIYEYSAQHDRLWEPSRIPAGDIFSRLTDAEPSDAPQPSKLP